MEFTHELLGLLCLVLDMLAAFQAMVGAYYKLALVGMLALVCLLIVVALICFSERKCK